MNKRNVGEKIAEKYLKPKAMPEAILRNVEKNVIPLGKK